MHLKDEQLPSGMGFGAVGANGTGVGFLISSKVKVITSKFHFTACSSKKLFYQ